jgi:Zn-finger nucleic acid-binding protein
LFLNRKAFEIMADRARDQVLPEQLLEAKSADQTPAGSSQEPAAFYRKCPECDKHMNRRSFGGKSGVVIDICRDHGLWFDAQELGTILKWIKQGGEARARRHLETERDHSNRQDRFKVDPTANVDRDGLRKSNLIGPSEMLGRFLGSLFDL